MAEHPPDIDPSSEPTPAPPSTAATVFTVILVLLVFFVMVAGRVVVSRFNSIQGHPL